MRLSRLFLMSLVLGSSLVACGGDDDPVVLVDAAPGIDAAPPVDAPPSIPMAEGLGKLCNQQTPCPDSAPICAIAQGSANGFCTLQCGTTPEQQNPMPPANGHQICQMAQPAPPSGTPLCVVTGGAQNGTIPWACGVMCGTFQGQELGNCPGGLTCVNNFCQP